MPEQRDLMPIMHGKFLRAVPFALFAGHPGRVAQANKNHRQTLDGLASRGGLSACEALAIWHLRPWHKMDGGEAELELMRVVSTTALG